MLDLSKELSVYKPTLLSLAFLFICIALWLAILLTTGKRRDKIRQDYSIVENAVQILHNVQFVKYDVTVSFMTQVLDTVTYLVPQVLDTAS